MKKWISILFAALMLFSVMTACAEKPKEAEEPAAETAQPTDAPEEHFAVAVDAPTDAPTAVPLTPEPTEESTEAPTSVPTAEAVVPEATRAPKDGDIATVNFPNYDTGKDADYSYQSDELRIAIKIHADTEAHQTYYVADIWMRSLDSFRTGFAHGKFNSGREEGDDFAKRENAILAVNGNFNQGLTLHAGELVKKAQEAKKWNSSGIGILYKDGTFKSFNLKRDKFNINTELKNGAWHGWQFGPALIQNGEIAQDLNRSPIASRNMIGYYEPGHYVIVTCDEARDDAIGISEIDMGNYMKALGVKEAFNLDGGTSAVMVFMGQIINNPTPRIDKDGKTVAGRPLVDMLLFAEYDADGKAPDLSTITAVKFKDINW